MSFASVSMPVTLCGTGEPLFNLADWQGKTVQEALIGVFGAADAGRCVMYRCTDGFPFSVELPVSEIMADETNCSVAVYAAVSMKVAHFLNKSSLPVMAGRQASAQVQMHENTRHVFFENELVCHKISKFLQVRGVLLLASACQLLQRMLLRSHDAPWGRRTAALKNVLVASLMGLHPGDASRVCFDVSRVVLPRPIAVRCAVGASVCAEHFREILQPFFVAANCRTENFRRVSEAPASVELHPGDQIDVLDTVNKWYDCTVLSVNQTLGVIGVHYNNWGSRWDETLPIDSGRIAPYRGKFDPSTVPYGDPTLDTEIRIGWMGVSREYFIGSQHCLKNFMESVFPEIADDLRAADYLFRQGDLVVYLRLMETRFFRPDFAHIFLADSTCYEMMPICGPEAPPSENFRLHKLTCFIRKDGFFMIQHRFGKLKCKY